MPVPKKVARKLRTGPRAVISHIDDGGLEQLGELFQKAMANGRPGDLPGSYHVQSLSLPEYDLPNPDLGAVGISKTTGEDFLKQGYGDEGWEKIRDSLLTNINPNGWIADSMTDTDPDLGEYVHGVPLHGQDRIDRLQRPVYEISTKRAPDSALAAAGMLFLNPTDLRKTLPGFSLDAVRQHEMGHVMNPVRPEAGWLPAAHLASEKKRWDLAMKRALLDGVTPDPEALESAIDNTHYFGTYDEIAANLSAAKRAYYGLTGKIPTSEPEYAEMFKFMSRYPEHPINTGHHTQTYLNSFNPDPVMEYGPNKGQRAHGWNSSKYQFNQILDDITPEELERLLNFSTSIASNRGASNAGTA